MGTIRPGRWTHDSDASAVGELVVFVIGMRINKPWRPDAWLPAVLAMGPMLAELSRDPDAGLLGFRTMLTPRGPVVVQYWRGTDALYRYASDTEAKHRPAWAAFNRRARRIRGAVGIFHETYRVGAAESIYVDMPPTGLAEAVGTVTVTPRANRAQDRLAG